MMVQFTKLVVKEDRIFGQGYREQLADLGHVEFDGPLNCVIEDGQ